MGFFDKVKSAAASAAASAKTALKDALKDDEYDDYDEDDDDVTPTRKKANEDTYVPPYRTAAYQDTPPAPAPAPAPEPAPAPAPAPAAEGMYDSALERLIDVALADGELTEKEKQVLFRRAESMGIDLDEFEMVLEARLYEKKRADASAAPVSAPAPTAAPTSNKFGDIKKCPNCGAIIQSFTARCVDCGYEFRGTEANQGIQRLFDMLNAVEEKDFRSTKTGLMALMDTETAMERMISRKASIIKNFPIPTTKDDILEFLVLSVPQAKVSFWSDDEEAKGLAPAWKAKCEQIIMKSKFAMKDDKEFLSEIEKYAKQLKIKM